MVFTLLKCVSNSLTVKVLDEVMSHSLCVFYSRIIQYLHLQRQVWSTKASTKFPTNYSTKHSNVCTVLLWDINVCRTKKNKKKRYR